MDYRVILCLAICLRPAINICAARQETITRLLEFKKPTIIEQVNNTCRVEMENTRPDDIPANPTMPLYSLSIEIPFAMNVDAVTLLKSPAESIHLNSPIAPAQPYFQPGGQIHTVNPNPLIYTSDTDYPQDNRLCWRADPTSSKTLLSILFSPLQYNPIESALLYYREITLSVSLSQAEPDRAPPRKLDRPLSPLDPDKRCDYLILSTSNLIESAVAPWDFNALRAQRQHSGFITEILPVEWIYANYPGLDRQEKIRHFLQNAQALWELKYLLIAGTHSLIPARKLHIEVSGIINDHIGDIPSDHIYYGCMEGSFDGNRNGLYGEYNDGDDGGDVDLTAEILVGRFPVENETELSHMIRKSLQYELAPKEAFLNNGFVSEKVDFKNITYARPFMEEIRNGSGAYGRDTLGYTTSFYGDDFNTTNNLHDSSGGLFRNTDALNYFTNRLHSINHFGHGSTYQCFKINSNREPDKFAIASLRNPFPWFVYSQACLSGAFDQENCFAEHFVTVSNAAVAVVMNARNGWVSASGIYGHSHFFHRHFWDSAFRGNATTYGEMNEATRRANLSSVPSFSASLWRWVYYQLNLLGDPALPVMPSLLKNPPAFTHEPLRNTFNTVSNHLISCDLEPIGVFDPESPYVVWSSNIGGGAVTQQMTRLPGNSYQLEIPPQPLHASIDYCIGASNRAGYASTEPASGSHTFHITDELSLLVAGSPADIGIAKPDYGVHSSASGLVINASAVDISYESEAVRYINKGFIGTGSVPVASTNQFTSFRIDRDSILIWRWRKQHRFTINSGLSAPALKEYWIDEDTSFEPPEADLYVTDPMTNLLAFAGWRLDGVRSPAPPRKSTPRHPPIISDCPRALTAVYVPVSQDSDGNGIEDWWEYQYFGAPGVDIFADHDGDGYDIYEEFEDRSDPLDPLSIPAPPDISHNPISSPANHPGALTVTARITDTHAVTNAIVSWRVNNEAWQTTPLTLTSNHIYSAAIAAETTAGDLIRYAIEARDPSGNFATTPTRDVFLAYPIADYSLLEDLLIVTKPDSAPITNSSLIINRGNMPLHWSLSCGFKETFRSESLTDLLNWQTTSIEQPWNISTNRALSAPHSLRAQLTSTRGSPHYASITLPPLLIGQNAVLSFSYWIDSEFYKKDPFRAFDGGLIEYSSDGGANFQQLSGAYTHEIYGWNLSPWPDKTPCFSGFSFGWQRAVFDLNEYHPLELGFEGQIIIFRFVYGGDDNTDHEGWYVDDIRVSPTSMPSGFSYSPPELNPRATAAGGYTEMLWRNLQRNMESQTEYTTVFFDSNAPENADGSFLWQALIREEPQINEFNLAQIPGGDGDIGIAIATTEKNSAALELQLEWSDDRGHNWRNAVLTNITVAPLHPDLNAFAPDGALNNVPGATNSIPATNNIQAIWNSAAPEADIGWCSNVYMRLTACNPWFSSSEIRVFPVDNIAPLFNPGSVAATPLSEGGDYLITDNLINLEWPRAIDTPSDNPVTYAIYAGTNLLKTHTELTQTTVAMTNFLDSTTTITIAPYDALLNRGEPLEFSALILNPESDYDNDGITTANEEIAGTDASDAQSRFIVTAFTGDANSFAISWSSVTNRGYTVERTTSLTAQPWSAVDGLRDIPGTGEIITAQLPRKQSAMFYRVRVNRARAGEQNPR